MGSVHGSVVACFSGVGYGDGEVVLMVELNPRDGAVSSSDDAVNRRNLVASMMDMMDMNSSKGMKDSTSNHLDSRSS